MEDGCKIDTFKDWQVAVAKLILLKFTGGEPKICGKELTNGSISDIMLTAILRIRERIKKDFETRS